MQTSFAPEFFIRIFYVNPYASFCADFYVRFQAAIFKAITFKAAFF